MILGYLDSNKKNIDVEQQRQQILDYASENGLAVDMFVQESKIEALKSSLKTDNHTLIVANVVVLGTTLKIISKNIGYLMDGKNTIILVKENLKIIPEEWGEIAKGINMAIELRSSLTSIITCKALSDVKASGRNLGRKSPNRKHFYTGREEEIKQKLAEGMPVTHLAKELGVTAATLFVFLRQHPELKPQKKRGE